MSFLALLFKVIPYLVPFLKEMFIGKRTWRQALRDHRGKTILVFTLILSIAFNLVLSAKVGMLAYQVLELSRAKQELEQHYLVSQKVKTVVEGSVKHPMDSGAEVATEVKKPAVFEHTKPMWLAPHDHDVTPEVQADFERIQAREAATEH